MKQLTVVKLASEAGITIREIRALFRDFGTDTTASKRWRTMAATKLQELDDVLVRTKLMRDIVTTMMECHCKTLVECGDAILRDKNILRRPRAR